MNREDFPILNQNIFNRPLVYLDNAATTQKPACVIEALSQYYLTINSNIHRGVHYLSQQATDAFEVARRRVQAFINAPSCEEVVFTRGATEAINLVASSFGRRYLNEGDEVLISEMEHHSNIVPWQLICEEKKAHLKVIPFDENGELELDKLERLISDKTRIVAVNHVSNTLGTINPIKQIVALAHKRGVPVMVDGAQAVSHLKVDVQDLDCDFYCFSGHKMYAPMGIGVMYGKRRWLEEMPPYQGGGEMIKNVTFEKTTYNELPFKFEAGTPSVGDVIGLNRAIDYIENVGVANIAAYEHDLLTAATKQLSDIKGLRIIGNASHKSAIISFVLDGIHPYDAGVIIDKLGVAVRTGHHCTQPIMDKLHIPGTIRASFAMYNTMEEVNVLCDAVQRAQMMLL